MSSMQTDRRPAIWPWLVMPLIALTAFYCLDRMVPENRKFSWLSREAQEQGDLAPAPAVRAESAPADVAADSVTP